MKTFLLLIMFTFPLLLIVACMLSFSRRKLRHTRHGLTGMCHSSGGTMCCSCMAKIQGPDDGSERV
ncbi:MAG: hypothetical protein F9K32_18250 [Desulfobulbaceae bacterium]|nr:MAG: hypothetical protein F9K32_18250 [Desulfobulbaceae bacterium]